MGFFANYLEDRKLRQTVRAFMRQRSSLAAYVDLLKMLQDRKRPFVKLGATFLGPGGIHVCDDIHGYEVKLGGCDFMLDCCPDAYNLNRDQADLLTIAILSNVPGSTAFAAKQKGIVGPRH